FAGDRIPGRSAREGGGAYRADKRLGRRGRRGGRALGGGWFDRGGVGGGCASRPHSLRARGESRVRRLAGVRVLGRGRRGGHRHPARGGRETGGDVDGHLLPEGPRATSG